MRGSQRNIHTRYHAMEAAGMFDNNPANPTSMDRDGMSLYKGPVGFPKMLYHPTGAERVIVPAELVLSPGGREIQVGEQRELIYRQVNNEAEESELLEEGWHTSPAKSIAAANDPKRPAPKESPAQVVADKDAEIERLKARLAAMGESMEEPERKAGAGKAKSAAAELSL